MEKTFLQACKEFFGTKPGQTSMDFLKETKALTPADRAEIAAGIAKETGWKIKETAAQEAVAA